jgi:uncharacterized integral membrane protein
MFDLTNLCFLPHVLVSSLLLFGMNLFSIVLFCLILINNSPLLFSFFFAAYFYPCITKCKDP